LLINNFIGEKKMSNFKKILIGLFLTVSFISAGCSSTPNKESLGETVDDSVITTKIKSLYVKDAAVSALHVSVETYKGVVQLSGFANNQTEIDRAVEIAREVKGVKSVKNDLHLKTNTSRNN
jgi:osmotically-inducible protein OsmY